MESKQPTINVDNVVHTLSQRIAQLEVERAVLLEQARHWQELARAGDGEEAVEDGR